MARIRCVKPDLFKDEDLSDLPHVYRWLLQGLKSLADARGILEYSPKRVMIEVLDEPTQGARAAALPRSSLARNPCFSRSRAARSLRSVQQLRHSA